LETAAFVVWWEKHYPSDVIESCSDEVAEYWTRRAFALQGWLAVSTPSSDTPDEAIFAEANRRLKCKMRHACTHCGRQLDDMQPCRADAHDTTMEENVTVEGMLQTVAHAVDAILPSGRGFAVVVANTRDSHEESRGMYVSNLGAESVPELFRGMADYIERREAAKTT